MRIHIHMKKQYIYMIAGCVALLGSGAPAHAQMVVPPMGAAPDSAPPAPTSASATDIGTPIPPMGVAPVAAVPTAAVVPQTVPVGIVPLPSVPTVKPIVPALPKGIAPRLATPAIGTTTSGVAGKKARLQEAVTGLERSFEARIMGLDGIAGHIQTRIAKLQMEGKDMTLVNAKFAAAQKLISAAKADLASLKKANATMVASKKPAVAFGTIKNKLVKNSTNRIKAAHAALVETIVLMKGSGSSSSATSSTSTVQ